METVGSRYIAVELQLKLLKDKNQLVILIIDDPQLCLILYSVDHMLIVQKSVDISIFMLSILTTVTKMSC